MKKIGFTLAEVLVTLGIIGVVSAMTIPSLMNNYQRQTYISQLHKVYNETQQAMLQFQTDKNAINISEAGLNTNAALCAFIENYFKVVSKCEATAMPCFAASYKNMNGSQAIGGDFSHRSYVLASGASIRPAMDKIGNKIYNLAVDINGSKGPNVAGRDLFWFYVYNNGMIDDYNADNTNAPLTKEQREATYSASCKTGVTGCFGKILNDNWQMNY